MGTSEWPESIDIGIREVEAALRERVERMHGERSRKAVDAVFKFTHEQYGRAAIKSARKRDQG